MTRRGQETNPKTLRQRTATALKYLMLLAGALLYIAPLLCMVAGSLKPDERVLAEAGSWRAFFPHGASLANYADVLERVAFGRFMLNSLIITGTIVFFGLIINAMAGYAFARLKWRGRDLLFTLVLSLMILPFEAIAVPLFYQISVLGWRDTYTAQILPFVANAFSIYLFYTAFIALPPELEESAYVDGAGVFRTFTEIVVPNAGPAFASVAILTFLTCWGMFLWPLMVTSGERVRPLTVAIAAFHTLPPLKWGDIMAFGVMMVSPVLILFIIFQRGFVRGIASTGTKG